jgi:hypothetical protein
MWSTHCTAGSALIWAMFLGNAATAASPYGMSPMTANV